MKTFHIRVSARALVVHSGRVLLSEYNDETGLHYNLPGGEVEPGETLPEAARRETWEEAGVRIEVGRLLYVIDYEPERNRRWASSTPAVSVIFEGRLAGPETGPAPIPATPDPHQTGAKWVPLADLEGIELLPHISPLILALARGESSGPAYLPEPIDPVRAFQYIE